MYIVPDGKRKPKESVKNLDVEIKKASNLKQTKPIAKVSKKMKVRLQEYHRAKKEYLKLHPICEVLLCKSRATDIHHKAGRIGENLTNQENFLAVCRHHHILIEQNPIESKEKGYSKDRLTN